MRCVAMQTCLSSPSACRKVRRNPLCSGSQEDRIAAQPSPHIVQESCQRKNCIRDAFLGCQIDFKRTDESSPPPEGKIRTQSIAYQKSPCFLEHFLARAITMSGYSLPFAARQLGCGCARSLWSPTSSILRVQRQIRRRRQKRDWHQQEKADGARSGLPTADGSCSLSRSVYGLSV
jgi:hypothetical protein